MSIRANIAKRLTPFRQTLVFDSPEFTIAGVPSVMVQFSPLVEEPKSIHFYNDSLLAASSPEIVSFSVIESPSQDSVAPIEKPGSVEFNNFLNVDNIEDVSDVIEEIFSIPRIESLLEAMARPSVAGRRYRETDQVLEEEGRQATFKIDMDVRCRHGLIRGQCQTCQDQRTTRGRSRGEKEATTVDVFEQLYYILQPPILQPAGQPTIFPGGKKPYGFQIAGVHWLVDRKAALLADEMGLGKTIQAIIALRVLFRNGELQRVLVVCPASLTTNWEREFRLWAPELRPLRVQGPPHVRAEAWNAHAQVYIVSYETLARDRDTPRPDYFELCILDEAQKIKNPATANHRGVKRITPKWRWALTGTPIENSVQDAVAIFDVLAPGLFTSSDTPTAAAVRRKIAPYTKRRSIEDADVDIPDLNHQEHWLELNVQQRARYDAIEKGGVENIKALGDGATRVHVFALISQLKQICNYDDDSDQSCKLDFLRDSLEEIAARDDKALVFSQYPVKSLQVIAPKLEEFKPLIFDGSLSSRERDARVQRFQLEEDNQILLMSIKAGGVGLTLTRANHVFHLDHWWNPAILDQGTARVRRIGQDKPVFAHSLYASNTVEERIARILEEKRQTFSEVFGNLRSQDDDTVINRLSDEDLFGLFGLKPPNQSESKGLEPMTPEEFENAVCTFFNAMGYNLSVTQRTRDGGIDLDGRGGGLGQGRVVVQCKRYSNPVGVGTVRELFGVISDDLSITQGFLVTTSRFTQDAQDFARGKRITLIDGTELEIRFSNLDRAN